MTDEFLWAEYGEWNEADIHVYPLDDIEEHDTETRNCWCNPDQNRDEPRVIVHNRAKDNPQ